MPISSALGSSALLPAGLGFRNLIINGDFSMNQRGFSSTASFGSYNFDRWRFDYSAIQALNAAVGNDTPTGQGFPNSLRISTTSSGSESVTSAWISQRLEGLNTGFLAWGTGNARSVMLSFWVKCSIAGIWGVSLMNAAQNRIYTTTYNINSTNTWEQKFLLIPGDTSGTWLADTSTGIELRFWVDATTAQEGANNSWRASGGIAPSGQSSIGSVNGATFFLTGVQLEANAQPTPFEFLPPAIELMLCQRYFHIISTGSLSSYNPYWNVQLSGGDQRIMYPFRVAMRISPNIQTSAGSNVHSFQYRNYNTGTANYNLEHGAGMSDVNGILSMGYYSTNNGGTLLPVGWTTGTNNNPVWVSAEL